MKKKMTKVIIIMLTIILLATGGFLLYASDYYHADSYAQSELSNAKDLIVENNMIIFPSRIPTDIGFIFYPGGKVEHTAYVPLMKKLSEKGITCVLVKMPLNLAIFDKNAADKVFGKFTEIEKWYVGGHSLGGAMASSYAAENKDKVDGLILLGAYIYGDVSPKDALTVYGTLNSNLEENIDYTENVVIIEGGNHAQFGNYGEQKGDPPATISSEEQQNIAVDAILNFIMY